MWMRLFLRARVSLWSTVLLHVFGQLEMLALQCSRQHRGSSSRHQSLLYRSALITRRAALNAVSMMTYRSARRSGGQRGGREGLRGALQPDGGQLQATDRRASRAWLIEIAHQSDTPRDHRCSPQLVNGGTNYVTGLVSASASNKTKKHEKPTDES